MRLPVFQDFPKTTFFQALSATRSCLLDYTLRNVCALLPFLLHVVLKLSSSENTRYFSSFKFHGNNLTGTAHAWRFFKPFFGCFSFCDLTVRFTVDVTGDTASRNFLPQLLSVVIVTVSSTVLLYISYVRYTKQTLNRHQEDEEEQQRLQELK